MKSFLCLLLLFFASVFFGSVDSHTTKICAVPNQNSVTFYACSYHTLNESGTVNGGLFVDGTRYNFAQVLPYNATLIPGSATCVGCGDGMPLKRCQVVTVQGLNNGPHTLSTSCDTIYECPYCQFPRMTLSNINTNPCLTDTEPPCITCTKTVTLYVDNVCKAYMPDLKNRTFACDRCSSTYLTQSVAQGTVLTLGSRNVTVTATDTRNNVASCKTVVNVLDNIPPTLVLTADPSSLWPPNHRMVNVTIGSRYSDNCPVIGSPNFNITHVVVDDNELGSGNTNGDWSIISRAVVQLRAERAGTGTGRTYYVVGRALDGNGNVVSAFTTVTVPHNP